MNLSVSKVTQTHIAPRETVAYNKETQTPHEVHDREGKTLRGLRENILLSNFVSRLIFLRVGV